MKTEELIRALTADGIRPVRPVGHTLLSALAAGSLVSIALFAAILHPRADVGQAFLAPAFEFKLLVLLCLMVASTGFLIRAALPHPGSGHNWLLLSTPLLMLTGIAAELAAVPMDLWERRWLGHNAAHCLSIVPLLSIPTLVFLFIALRGAAPARPWLAGAIAGLVSGGVGGFLYALTCPDDSPLFVATWYSIAIGMVAGAAATAGSRWLQW